MKRINVTDITLTALEGAHLLFREKVAAVKKIDSFGADKIVLPSIKKPKEDSAIYRTIAKTVQNAELCVKVGNDADGVMLSWEAIKEAIKPCLIVSLPVSTVTMEYTLGIKNSALLEKVASLVTEAKKYCERVEFEAIDASRADFDFLLSVCKKAVECGVCGITVCDDAGVLIPDETEELAMLLCPQISVPVTFCVSNKIGLGLSCALSAINAGADGVCMSVCGNDVLSTELFAGLVKEKGEALGISSNLKSTEVNSDIRELVKSIGTSTVIDKNTNNINGGAFDENTDISVIKEAVISLGYELDDRDLGLIKDELRRVCLKKGSVGIKELEAVVATSANLAPSTYHLESYVVTSSNVITAVAHVVLNCDDGSLNGVGTGDGPIDSSFKAIEQCIGCHYELDDFQIQSVTKGKEALGSALVRLRSNGKLYSGNGISTDIVGASIRAYLNALNKIVYEENRT